MSNWYQYECGKYVVEFTFDEVVYADCRKVDGEERATFSFSNGHCATERGEAAKVAWLAWERFRAESEK